MTRASCCLSQRPAHARRGMICASMLLAAICAGCGEGHPSDGVCDGSSCPLDGGDSVDAGGESANVRDGGERSDGGIGEDAGTQDGGLAEKDGGVEDAGSPTRITTTATDGTLALNYDVTIDGSGSARIGALSIDHGTGTVTVGGTSLPAVAYEQIPYSAAGDTLYQILAVAPDFWAVVWAYCSAGALSNVYSETTDGMISPPESASGTCNATSDPVSATVQFPATDLPIPTLVSGFSIDGTTLAFDGQHPGTMTFGGDSWAFYPFTSVDCSTQCGSPGWYELHSVITQIDTMQACYGIYYLQLNKPNQVSLDYVLCLPSLTELVGARGAAFAATYTHP